MHDFISRHLFRAFLLCALIAVQANVRAQSGNISPALNSVIQKLSISATPDKYRQVVEAIESSELLKAQLNQICIAGKLKDIKVLRRSDLPHAKGRSFGGFADGSTIYLSVELMAALLNSRAYDVLQTDEVLPNNTVFVLAHLAHHLVTFDDLLAPGRYPSRDAYVNARIEDESSALIQAWNATVDDATRRNGKRQLSTQQAMGLLMNIRYRSIFLKAMNIGTSAGPAEEALKFLPSGAIEASKENMKAFARAIRESNMPDVE